MKKASLTRKLICLLLINTALIPLLVNILEKSEWFQDVGLINDVAIIIALNAVMPPLPAISI